MARRGQLGYMDAPKGNELLEFVRGIGALEWTRYQPRYPLTKAGNGFVEDLKSTRLPCTSFRFEDEKPEVVARLSAMIKSYEGALEWTMKPHVRAPLPGINWAIEPAMVSNLRAEAESLAVPVSALIQKTSPNFYQVAFQDLLSFTKYIQTNWGAF